MFLVWIAYGTYSVYFASSNCSKKAPAVYNFTRLLLFGYWIVLIVLVVLSILGKIKTRKNMTEEEKLAMEKRK